MKSSFIKFILISFIILIEASSFSGEASNYLAYVDSADVYIKREAWPQAENMILKALREEPGNFQNHLLFSNLGIVRQNLKDYNGALESFRLGLSIAPNSTVLLNNRARLFLLMQNYEEALKDLNKSLGIDSLQEWSIQMKATILMNSGNYTDAQAQYIFITENWPDNSGAYFGLGKIHEADGEINNALTYYKKAWELEKHPEFIASIIETEIRNEHYQEASAYIREGLNIFPDEPMLYILRGYLNKLNFRNSEAEADAKLAIAKGADPETVRFYLQSTGR